MNGFYERALAQGLEYGLSKEGFEVLWAEAGVQDNGSGIPPEDLEHIFDRF